LMLDTVVFVYEVELDHNANWSLDTLDLSLLSNVSTRATGLQRNPAAERMTSEWMVPVIATLALVGMLQSHLRYLTTFPFPSLK
jgi:hypothetical protein